MVLRDPHAARTSRRRLRRVRSRCRARGYLLLAFQTGDEIRHIQHAYGHDVELDAWRLPVEGTLVQLEAAGFARQAELVRAPIGYEKVPQAFLLLRRGAREEPADDM